MKERKRKRNDWRVWAVTAVIAIIFVVFALVVDWGQVVAVLKTADFRYLLIGSIFLLVGLVGYAVRWRLLMRNKPTLQHTFHASNIGHAGNILVPARAGEAARIVVIGRSTSVSITEATSSFVVERLVEQFMRLFALTLAVGLGLGISFSFRSVGGAVVVVVAAVVGIIWLLNNRQRVLLKGPALLARLPWVGEDSARDSLTDLMANLADVSHPPRLARVLLWSAIPWGFFAAFQYVTLLSLGDVFPAPDRLLIAIGILAFCPPSAPTNPGLYHAFLVGPLVALGYNREAATAYAVILHIVQTFWMVALAAVGVALMKVSLDQLWQGEPAAQPSSASSRSPAEG